MLETFIHLTSLVRFFFLRKRRDSVPKNRSQRKSFEVGQGLDEIKSRKSITSYHYRSRYERKMQGFIPVKTSISKLSRDKKQNLSQLSPFLFLFFFFFQSKNVSTLCLIHSRFVQHLCTVDISYFIAIDVRDMNFSKEREK